MPLISSTCNMVSAAYASTKESHPHVKTVCDAAEKGVKTLTAAAISGAQPLLSKLEPQSKQSPGEHRAYLSAVWGGGRGAAPPRSRGACPRPSLDFSLAPSLAVTSASEYAHRGLDKLEENLPILQQQTEKVTGLHHREPRGGRGLSREGVPRGTECGVPSQREQTRATTSSPAPLGSVPTTLTGRML